MQSQLRGMIQAGKSDSSQHSRQERVIYKNISSNQAEQSKSRSNNSISSMHGLMASYNYENQKMNEVGASSNGID